MLCTYRYPDIVINVAHLEQAGLPPLLFQVQVWERKRSTWCILSAKLVKTDQINLRTPDIY
jgi:hypothetical protein